MDPAEATPCIKGRVARAANQRLFMALVIRFGWYLGTYGGLNIDVYITVTWFVVAKMPRPSTPDG
jgi:hypothetical protein